MKKGRFLLLGLGALFCGVGLSGCAPAAEPTNVVVSGAKVQFEIGDEFVLDESMIVKLEFEDGKSMDLEKPNGAFLVKDPTLKKIYAWHYEVDYSQFNSAKAGDYPIFVNFLDRDGNSDNDIRTFFKVNVKYERNEWVSHTALEDWTYGQTPNLVLPQAKYNNSALVIEYKGPTDIDFKRLNIADANHELKELDAGDYLLRVTFEENGVYSELMEELEFTVNRAVLPEGVEAAISLGSREFTGDKLVPVLATSNYYAVDMTGADEWIDVGLYDVPVLVNPNYKWAATEEYAKTFPYVITPAENTWIGLDVNPFDMAEMPNGQKGWVKGEFSEYNLSQPVSRFGMVTYAWKTVDAVDEAYVDFESVAAFNDLPEGEYEIKAYVKHNDNYTDIEEILEIVVYVVAE